MTDAAQFLLSLVNGNASSINFPPKPITSPSFSSSTMSKAAALTSPPPQQQQQPPSATTTSKAKSTSSSSIKSIHRATNSNTSSNASYANSNNHEANDHVQLRNLETWHDEDGVRLDESFYQELVDPSNSNGWSADEMFKYNERMHKINSNYNEKTLADNYTTPVPKINSRMTIKLASQLAKEIEDRVIAEGRVTPESSDDDELFNNERMKRVQLKQQKQLDKLKSIQRQTQHHQQNQQQQLNYQEQQQRYSNSNLAFLMNNLRASKAATTNSTAKSSSSQYSNSSNKTPATTSLSSSPTLNDTCIKPVTSSSRNILRTCLT